jgi:DmsE family decaheme c-type cytochrome
LGGVACADCHNPHPEIGTPMSVDQPGACYRCHSQMRQLEEVAHPHQILGPNGFNCSSCHRPHGRIDSTTRTDTCLKCHDGTPTMAWHSSSHHREGVACADCHNAHPETRVPRYVSINHTSVNRRPRLPMCVDEPAVCYECHADIYGKVSMPSHHPIKEGKMVCSDCHDGHGQNKGNLKADSLNDLCCDCHAEKEGPFVWEHPPVTENCAICHDPHGTVANNLLHQPTTFLCLRCHTGHSTHESKGANTCFRCHSIVPFWTNIGSGPRPPAQPTTPVTRKALFTDCTQCHAQIHGTDLTSGFECGAGFRR